MTAESNVWDKTYRTTVSKSDFWVTPRQAKNYWEKGVQWQRPLADPHRRCHCCRTHQQAPRSTTLCLYCLGLTKDAKLPPPSAYDASRLPHVFKERSVYPGLRVQFCDCCEVDANVVATGKFCRSWAKLCPFCQRIVADSPQVPEPYKTEEVEAEEEDQLCQMIIMPNRGPSILSGSSR